MGNVSLVILHPGLPAHLSEQSMRRCVLTQFLSPHLFTLILLLYALHHHLVSLILDVFVLLFLLGHVICTMKLIYNFVLLFYFNTIGE